jgi:hypothetical protein
VGAVSKQQHAGSCALGCALHCCGVPLPGAHAVRAGGTGPGRARLGPLPAHAAAHTCCPLLPGLQAMFLLVKGEVGCFVAASAEALPLMNSPRPTGGEPGLLVWGLRFFEDFRRGWTFEKQVSIST